MFSHLSVQKKKQTSLPVQVPSEDNHRGVVLVLVTVIELPVPHDYRVHAPPHLPGRHLWLSPSSTQPFRPPGSPPSRMAAAHPPAYRPPDRLRVVYNKSIPRSMLKSSLVSDGRRKCILAHKSSSTDHLSAVTTMGLSPSGDSFTAMSVFLVGPDILLTVPANQIFEHGDPTTELRWYLKMDNIIFPAGSWETEWKRGPGSVPCGGSFGVPDFKIESGFWCTQYVVYAETDSSLRLLVQALPICPATILSSPWTPRKCVAGITLYTSDPFTWSETLPPVYGHYGPKPFLRDGRAPEFMDVLPSSQEYRDHILKSLKQVTRPRSITTNFAKDYVPDGSDYPSPGVFVWVIERTSPPRRPTPAPPPSPSSSPTPPFAPVGSPLPPVPVPTTGNPAPGRTTLFFPHS